MTDLRHAEQQMLAARPWDAAEPESLWSITGEYPYGKGRFRDCLAMTLPAYVTGSTRPVFMFCSGALLLTNREPIDPALITHAVPLLIVHRDQPARAYWDDDQDLLDGTR
jgi:hypothetical protein